MRGKHLSVATILVLAVLGSIVPAHARPAVPFDAHPRGRSYETWLRDIGQFYLGDASNPLFAALQEGDCGQLIDGVFFLASTIDVGLEFDCNIPTGTPIVFSHAGFFTTEGIDGDTDAELIAGAEAGFTITSSTLTLDGEPIPVRPIRTGAYDVISEPGSFYDEIIGVGTGPIRTALVGYIVFLHPLPPGDHTIEAEVTFAGAGGSFSATYHLHVG